jgi:hypothetical protein
MKHITSISLTTGNRIAFFVKNRISIVILLRNIAPAEVLLCQNVYRYLRPVVGDFNVFLFEDCRPVRVLDFRSTLGKVYARVRRFSFPGEKPLYFQKPPPVTCLLRIT